MKDEYISRQAAINAIENTDCELPPYTWDELTDAIMKVPSAQPKQTDCEYCHEDSDGYVRPLEKNCHAFVRYGINGWEISLKAKGWSGSAKIKYCPMCGRELKHG